MELRAFSICRTCFEAYSARSACPHCASDQVPAALGLVAAPGVSPRGSVPAEDVVADEPSIQLRPSWTPVVAIATVAVAMTILLASVINAV
ncbi:MAG TPA: hypothetical protein VML75_12870 [Kofleriaceae bacterium]|nr:hypothetical protein [Kofleriaceae bacterium]